MPENKKKYTLEVGDTVLFNIVSYDEDDGNYGATQITGVIDHITAIDDGHLEFCIENDDRVYDTRSTNILRIDKPVTHISQSVLIDKLIKFIDTVSTSSGSKETEDTSIIQKRSEKIGRGLCFGFSIVHSYMAAKKMSAWWESMLAIAAKWDGKEMSLSSSVNMPEQSIGSIYKNKKEVTYREIYERLANYVLYNFADSDVSGMPKLEQRTFLLPNGPFVSEDGGIQTYLSFGGHFEKERLEALLKKIEVLSPIEGIMIISSLTHCCALRYSEEEKAWYLYDPNHAGGAECFNRERLINEIFPNSKKYLGQNFIIEIASWKNKEEAIWFKELEDYRSQFYDFQNPQNNKLLDEQGLHVIVKYIPDQLKRIIEQINNNSNLKNKFAEILQTQDNKAGNVFLYYLAECFTEELKNIIEIADKDLDFREKLCDSLSLKLKSNDGWTAMHAILEWSPNEIKNKAIEYVGGANAVIEDLYESYQKGIFNACRDDLTKYIKYILSATNPTQNNSNTPTLTKTSLKYIKEILQEGILLGTKKPRTVKEERVDRITFFSGRITPITNEDLKKHLAAHAKTAPPKIYLF